MKKTSTFQNGLIWFGAGVSIAEILTGTYFAPLGMGKGIARHRHRPCHRLRAVFPGGAHRRQDGPAAPWRR